MPFADKVKTAEMSGARAVTFATETIKSLLMTALQKIRVGRLPVPNKFPLKAQN